MPLHLSQHKSYHPYNQDNRERVRRDQAQAAQHDEERRQTSFAHRDHARLEALRAARNGSRADSSRGEAPQASSSSSRIDRLKSSREQPKGHALLRPADELTPWYTTSQLRNGADTRKTEDQRLEDAYKQSSTKSSNDPLKAMQTFLAQRKAAKDQPRPPPSSGSVADIVSDLYEPDAVRAARSSRRRHSDHRGSHSRSDRDRTSTSHRRSDEGVNVKRNDVAHRSRRHNGSESTKNDDSRSGRYR